MIDFFVAPRVHPASPQLVHFDRFRPLSRSRAFGHGTKRLPVLSASRSLIGERFQRTVCTIPLAPLSPPGFFCELSARFPSPSFVGTRIFLHFLRDSPHLLVATRNFCELSALFPSPPCRHSEFSAHFLCDSPHPCRRPDFSANFPSHLPSSPCRQLEFSSNFLRTPTLTTLLLTPGRFCGLSCCNSPQPLYQHPDFSVHFLRDSSHP